MYTKSRALPPTMWLRSCAASANRKKIGHTGTLDPEASGVLPVCLGNATKLCDLLTDKDKEYRAVLLLGVETDTQDTTGQILAEKEVNAGEEDVRSAILSFVGPYDRFRRCIRR